MPIFKNKSGMVSFKRKIHCKIKSISEQSDKIVSDLKAAISLFELRAQQLELDEENFYENYEMLNQSLETYDDRLLHVQELLSDIYFDSNSSNNSQQDLLQDVPDGYISSKSSCATEIDNSDESKSTKEEETLIAFLRNSNQGLTLSNSNNENGNLDLAANPCSDVHPVSSDVSSDDSFSQESNYYSFCVSSNDQLNLLEKTSSALKTEKLDEASQNSHFKENYQENGSSHSQTFAKNIIIVLKKLEIAIPSTISANVAHIINPSDFWLQMKFTPFPSYAQSKYTNLNPFTTFIEGDFCLAPFKNSGLYYRAQILNIIESANMVKVIFIDHGSTQTLSLKQLRLLPKEACKVPMLAIHCFLNGILPSQETWSKKAEQKFKELLEHDIEEVHIVAYHNQMYGVELKITTPLFNGSLNIGKMLYLEHFAILSNEETLENVNRISTDSGVSVASNDLFTSLPQKSENTTPPSSFEEEVLIISNYQNKQVSNQAWLNNEKIEQDCYHSFDSNEFEYDANSFVKETKYEDCYQHFELRKSSNDILCDMSWDLTVASPTISFVKQDMAIVIISEIINPNEFYVNLASEDVICYEEMQEQMTLFYNSLPNSYNYVPSKDDLKVNMYCVGRFSKDNIWCRVKILEIYYQQNPEEISVYVLYIDYGHNEILRLNELRPLVAEFAKPPAIAIKCSLAGVKPLPSNNICDAVPYLWDEISIQEFRTVASNEKCLTAQFIDEESDLFNDQLLYVLLWGMKDSEDVLINKYLATKGLATFDTSLLSKLANPPQENVINENPDLENYDPMADDYNKIENSYAVDIDDVQVALFGYKAQDEKYICKYYSLRGYCPRKNCPYEHEQLLEGNVTRDRKDVYVGHPPQLPKTLTSIFIKICALISPCHFYAILPFGCKPVEEINQNIKKNFDGNVEDCLNLEPYYLTKAMNNYYNNAPFSEDTTISLAHGNIVAAINPFDKQWSRARVITVNDIAEPAELFFVDSGYTEWVPRRNIREIKQEFLFAPFQAIECFLWDIEPRDNGKGFSWSQESISYFRDLVEDQLLLAYVHDKIGSIIYLSLKTTKENDHENIEPRLVQKGFAQYISRLDRYDHSFSSSEFIPG